MLGTSIGVNMLKADPRLWVPVNGNYSGFVFKPTKGWLGYATKQNESKYNGRDRKTSGTFTGLQTTTTKVCS